MAKSNTNNANNITSLIPRIAKGDPILATWLTQVAMAINQLSKGVKPPAQVFQQAGSGTLQQMIITDITTHDDALVCHTWDGTNEGTEDMIVAKPARLRNEASWNGLTFTYTTPQEREADDGSDTEDQVVVPAYVIDDIIYVAAVDFTDVTDGGSPAVPLILLDINADARAWAKVDA